MTRILIVGAGATGGYLGSRLIQAGRDVTFLVRPRRAETLRARGLRLVGLGEQETVKPRIVTAGELSEPYDLVLLSVKADAMEKALEDLRPAAGPDSVVIPFLNGIAHLDELNQRFGAESVLGCVVKVATKLSPEGDIVRLAPFASMEIGQQDGNPSPRLNTAAAALDGAGFDFAVSPDIIEAMWGKWSFIVTATVTTCLMRGTIGEVTAVPGGADFGLAALNETLAVCAAAGYPVPDGIAGSTRAMVTQQNSPFAPSMYRDLMDGLPTEVEHVLADLATRAREWGVPTPLLDLAIAHLRVHQNRALAR